MSYIKKAIKSNTFQPVTPQKELLLALALFSIKISHVSYYSDIPWLLLVPAV